MTEHDISRASEHDPDRGTDHATSAEPTPLPRRRDIHHPSAPHTPRRHRRRGLPVALTVMALSTGMATGVAAAATAEQAPAAPTPSTGPTPAATARTITVGTDLAGPSSEAVADAQAALARAKIVSADSLSVTGKERKRITRLAEQVRELVDDSPTGERAPAAASRSTEREPLDERADAERTDTAGEAAAPGSGDDGDTSGTPARPAPEPVTARGTNPVGTAPLVLPAAADAIAPETLEIPTVVAGTGSGSGAQDDGATDRADDAASRTDAERPELSTVTRSLTTVLDEAQGTDAEIEPAPATPAEILDAQARAARDAAPMLARHADDTSGYENGRIPGGDLCELSFAADETLRCDAAEQLERLDTAFRARFGAHLAVRDSYRSYDSQVAVKATKGYLAAVPGYSNHGWGVAVDLSDGVQDFGSAQYAWLREHAPDFGWDNPGWARSDGRKPEAWHWEYTPLR